MSNRWLIRNRKYAYGLAVVALLLGSATFPLWQLFAPNSALALNDDRPIPVVEQAPPAIAAVFEEPEPELLPPLPPLPRGSAIAQAPKKSAPAADIEDALGGGEPIGTGGGGSGTGGKSAPASTPGSTTFSPGEFDFLPRFGSTGGPGGSGGSGGGNGGDNGGEGDGDDAGQQPGANPDQPGDTPPGQDGDDQPPAGTPGNPDDPDNSGTPGSNNPGTPGTPGNPGGDGDDTNPPIEPPPYQEPPLVPTPGEPGANPNNPPVAVMEPSALWLFVLGCAGLALARRQTRHA